MKLNIKEVEEYISKLDNFLSELNNLAWSGLESQIKSTTVTHFKSKVSKSFEDEVEEREFLNQINQSIEKVEDIISEVIIEKYKIINDYRKYVYSETFQIDFMGKSMDLDYKSLKLLLRDLKDTQDQFYQNILDVKQEKVYGARDGIYIDSSGNKVEYEYDTMIEIMPIYDEEYLENRNTKLKDLIFNIERKLDDIYINKDIEFSPKFLTHNTIYELFK